jgi:hypothetical protein
MALPLDALAKRLDRLRAQTGAASGPCPDAVAEEPAVFDLGALRRAQARRDARRHAATEALPGEEIARGVRRVRSVVAAPSNQHPAPDWEVEPLNDRSPVYIDTETTGLAGGSGTLVFLIGLAQRAGDSLELQQFLLCAPTAEQEFLAAVSAALPPSALLVSFNGRSFDLPLLAARYRLARLPDPFARRPHWDLMHPLRRAFARRWSDCRLQSAERRLLGIERCDDLPGAFAPQAYTQFLRFGATELLQRLLAHHRQDVASLPLLLDALLRVHAAPSAFDADAVAMARALERSGRSEAAERLLRAAHGDDGAALALGRQLRRARRWSEAESVLARLAHGTGTDSTALEQLAMIAEHVRGDFVSARSYCLTLVRREPDAARHRRRLARLERRLARIRAD